MPDDLSQWWQSLAPETQTVLQDAVIVLGAVLRMDSPPASAILTVIYA